MNRTRNRFGYDTRYRETLPPVRLRQPERRDGNAVAFILGVLLACVAGAAFVALRY